MSGELVLAGSPGPFEVADVYVEYDGPRVFRCVDSSGVSYICLYVDESDTYDVYVFARMSSRTESQLVTNRISLRLAVSLSVETAIVRLPYDGSSGSWEPVDSLELQDDYLPAPGLALDGTVKFGIPAEWVQHEEPGRLTFEFSSTPSNALTLDGSVDNLGVSLAIDGRPIWRLQDTQLPVSSIQGTVRDLAQAWPAMLLEQGLPSGLSYTPLNELRSEAERFDSRRAKNFALSLTGVLDRYSASHDLAVVMGLKAAPSVWVVPDGRYCWLLTDTGAVRSTTEVVMTALEGLVDRLLEVAPNDAAVKAWRDRWKLADSEIGALATGLSQPAVQYINQRIGQSGEMVGPDGNPLTSEILAVARLASDLSVEAIADALALVSSGSGGAFEALDALSTGVLADPLEGRPYEQGLIAARWLRDRLSIENGARVEPEHLLMRLGVAVEHVRLDSKIDAVAAWGPNHGPIVFVNQLGIHAKGRNGRRTTLAHELGHLLLDRQGALPLGDVLAGAGTQDVERRASAFAVELLLPQEWARQAFEANRDRVDYVVTTLSRDFGLSAESVAWQIRNSGVELGESHATLRNFLRSKRHLF